MSGFQNHLQKILACIFLFVRVIHKIRFNMRYPVDILPWCSFWNSDKDIRFQEEGKTRHKFWVGTVNKFFRIHNQNTYKVMYLRGQQKTINQTVPNQRKVYCFYTKHFFVLKRGNINFQHEFLEPIRPIVIILRFF